MVDGRGPRRRVLIIVAVLLVVVGLPVVVQLTSVQPGAALVKAAFELGPLVKPGPDFAAVSSRVTVTADLPVPVASAPAAVLDVYTPTTAAAGPRPIILWVHGGGYLSGDRRQVADYARMLAERNFTVASLEYSLAPGHRYPTPIRQGNAALAYLVANAGRFGGDPAAIIVGGDSAGAQIASQLAALQTNPALAEAMGLEAAVPAGHLRAAVLFCGLFDLDTVGATHFPAIRQILWSYTGRREWTDFPAVDQLSTTRQVTAAFPPTFLTVGDKDPFRTQVYALDAALRARGVEVGSRYWQGSDAGLGHEYQFDFTTAEARSAFTDTVAFLDAHRR